MIGDGKGDSCVSLDIFLDRLGFFSLKVLDSQVVLEVVDLPAGIVL